jgi:arylformamidase
MLYDISPRVSPALAVWPGDTPPSREVLLDMAKGDNLTLSTLRATVHLGAHVDAPSHYGRNGRSIEGVELTRYVGVCQVMHVDVDPGVRFTEKALRGAIAAPRVLFATGTYPEPTLFTENFAAPSPSVIDVLSAKGVVLVGVDTPSVDLFESKDLPTHHACLRNDVAILEGLVLDEVPDGVYELIALPLKLVGFDASPVRAVLRAMGDD